jgi:hypothetical protein
MPSPSRRRDGRGADAQDRPTATRPDQGDSHPAGPIRDVLERPVRLKGASRAPAGSATPIVLGVLSASRRARLRLRLRRNLLDGRGCNPGRSRGSLARGHRTFSLAGPEDEDGGEAEEDRGGERHHRSRGHRIERTVE